MDHDCATGYDLALQDLRERRAKLAKALEAAWRAWDVAALEACDREDAMLEAEAAALGL